MIDYDNKNSHMLITCDTCGEEFEEYGDYKYCVSEARLDGWKIVKKKGQFHHYCSENCKSDFKPKDKKC